MIGQLVAGILRTVLLTVGGAQVGQGWLTDDQLQQLVGAVLTIVAVGWQIAAAARRRTKAGGEWNPRAEVRRAEPVAPGTARQGWRGIFGRRDGGARVSVLGALGIVALVVAVAGFALGQCSAWPWRVERTETWPDVVAEQPDLSVYLRPAPREDGRGFWVRLAESVRVAVSGVKVRRVPDAPEGSHVSHEPHGTYLVSVGWKISGGADW